MQSLQNFFIGWSFSDKLSAVFFALGSVVALIVAFLSFIGNVYTPVVQAKWNIIETQSKDKKTDIQETTEPNKLPITKTVEQNTDKHTTKSEVPPIQQTTDKTVTYSATSGENSHLEEKTDITGKYYGVIIEDNEKFNTTISIEQQGTVISGSLEFTTENNSKVKTKIIGTLNDNKLDLTEKYIEDNSSSYPYLLKKMKLDVRPKAKNFTADGYWESITLGELNRRGNVKFQIANYQGFYEQNDNNSLCTLHSNFFHKSQQYQCTS